MIRQKIEARMGKLDDEVWTDTCTIATNDLFLRRKHNFKNDIPFVIILCEGIADAINKGYIRKGAS